MSNAQPKQQNRRTRTMIAFAAVIALVLLLLAALQIGSAEARFIRTSANPGSAFSAGALNITSTKNGTTILSVTKLLPGRSANGTAPITTGGDYSAAVTLTGTSDGSALAQNLTLLIENTPGTATTVWTGKMSDFSSVSLGTFTSGTPKTFRFTVTFPTANAVATLQDAATTETLRFTGVGQ
jgi:hypothetical protein